MSTEIAPRGPAQMVQGYSREFALVLPAHVKPETFTRLAVGVLRRSDTLAAAATRNPASLMAALLECARLGHEPGTDAFYLVPMGGEIEGWESYKGLIQRMYRAGKVASVKAEVVRERDDFTFHPGMDYPDHHPDWFTDRGDIIGAYAYARLADGTHSRVAVINRADIKKVRKESRGSTNASSPWVKWYEQMVLKTVVKRLEPWVTTSTEWMKEQLRAVRDVAHEPIPATVQTDQGPVDTDTGEILDGEVIP